MDGGPSWECAEAAATALIEIFGWEFQAMGCVEIYDLWKMS